jgi:hypothetical protein
MKIKKARMQWSQSKRSTKSVMYFFPTGETILDSIIAQRRKRPVKEYRALIPEICAAVGITNMQDLKFSWSQKAGCSCGCSPGFVVKGLYCKKIFVDVTMENDFEGLSL